MSPFLNSLRKKSLNKPVAPVIVIQPEAPVRKVIEPRKEIIQPEPLFSDKEAELNALLKRIQELFHSTQTELETLRKSYELLSVPKPNARKTRTKRTVPDKGGSTSRRKRVELDAEACDNELNKFWSKPIKYPGRQNSSELIGKLYEQYVGWTYERQGWSVDYYGMSEGFDDLGRDLICKKARTTLIVQCKKWSASKEIHEKHIFQLIGTTSAYRREKADYRPQVHGVFWTSAKLSPRAKMFAEEFGIEIHEDSPLQRFPSVKCIKSSDDSRVYYLPMEVEYFSYKGDTYFDTVAEAEKHGFIHAATT